MSKQPTQLQVSNFPDEFIMVRHNQDGETESRRYVPADRPGLKITLWIAFILIGLGVAGGFVSAFHASLPQVVMWIMPACFGAVLLYAVIGEV